jgi:hypothetical protein
MIRRHRNNFSAHNEARVVKGTENSQAKVFFWDMAVPLVNITI